MNAKRYNLLDILRALAVISMVLYHTLWDMKYIFEVSLPFMDSWVITLWLEFIRITFIGVSGFCWHFGRKKIKRALTVLLASALVYFVTALFMSSSPALFGVLFLLGVSPLITTALQKPLDKINPYFAAPFFFCLYALTRYVRHGYIGIFAMKLFELPEILYNGGMIGAAIGFKPEGFVSSDYFPIIPWIFLYLVGFYVYKILREHSLLDRLCVKRIRVLEFIGRHALVIYLLHQAVIFALLYVIFKIIG